MPDEADISLSGLPTDQRRRELARQVLLGVQKRTQEELATLFNVSQATISGDFRSKEYLETCDALIGDVKRDIEMSAWATVRRAILGGNLDTCLWYLKESGKVRSGEGSNGLLDQLQDALADR